ncbi:MAG: crossover junction endodeoxyribonuclease RuvC [Halobacteriota archaeon]|nr:crossover junction endodeoxyribonuclease RuvC [Halobacteriota archaeon]
MKVMGIDPGIAITGYGIIEENSRRNFDVKEYGCIRTPKGDTPSRLKKVYDDLSEILKVHHPDTIAVEELFMYKNVKTAMSVSQSRGVIILAGVNQGLEVAEYTPLQVKQSVVGYGRATKNQVQQMVKTILNLDEIPRPDDAADALAVAICHLNSASLKKVIV